MARKLIKYGKFLMSIALIFCMVFPSVANTTGSPDAFITKEEFDKALADFNDRLTTFEAGINSKIDSQVTSYLDRNGIWSGSKQEFWAWWEDPEVGTFKRDCKFDNEDLFTAGGPVYPDWSPFMWQGGNNVVPLIKEVTKSGLLFIQFPYTKMANYYSDEYIGKTAYYGNTQTNAKFCSFFQIKDWHSLNFVTTDSMRARGHVFDDEEPLRGRVWEDTARYVGGNDLRNNFTTPPTNRTAPGFQSGYTYYGLGSFLFNYYNTKAFSGRNGTGMLSFVCNQWCGIANTVPLVGQSMLYLMKGFPYQEQTNETKLANYLYAGKTDEDLSGWNSHFPIVTLSLNDVEASYPNNTTVYNNQDVIYNALRDKQFMDQLNIQIFVEKGNCLLIQAGLGCFSYKYGGYGLGGGGGYREQGVYPMAVVY